MPKIYACLFDLDGVIVDTAKYHYLAWKRLAATLGFAFTEAEYERLKGVSRLRALDILLEIGNVTASETEKARLAARKNAWYLEAVADLDNSAILPGAKAFVTTVRAAGIKTALGSASKNAPFILANIQMANNFDVVVDGTKTAKAKPNPEVFLLCAALLNAAPEDCVVFEDAAAGITAAKRAGMRAVGVGAKNVLYEADDVVASLREMSLKRLYNLSL